MFWLQGHIKHDRIPLGTVDPRTDLLNAHRLFPERAEPLIWLCWHHHKVMDACPQGTAGTEVCWLRERISAYYYARKAAALPMPDVRLPCYSPPQSGIHMCAVASSPWCIIDAGIIRCDCLMQMPAGGPLYEQAGLRPPVAGRAGAARLLCGQAPGPIAHTGPQCGCLRAAETPR